MTENISWDTYFMTLVYVVSMKSKDQSTNIGAVVVGPDNEIRTTGYNSFPRGINDNVPERQIPDEKYFWFAHGEKNAIDNASRIGVSLKNCIMYTQATPCMDCARSIVQSGIKEVVIHSLWEDKIGDIWKKNAKRTRQLFNEAGVNLRVFDGSIISEICGYCRKEKIEL